MKLKSEIIYQLFVFDNVSHLKIEIFNFKFNTDIYIIREKISCYSQDPEYDFLSFYIIHFIHKENIKIFFKNLKIFFKNLENNKLEYIPEIQKVVNKMEKF